jgi:hypothetical protein
MSPTLHAPAISRLVPVGGMPHCCEVTISGSLADDLRHFLWKFRFPTALFFNLLGHNIL